MQALFGDGEGAALMDPTARGDCIADDVRHWYEANRETWWQRRKRRGDVADEFMLGLINEVRRVERSYTPDEEARY